MDKCFLGFTFGSTRGHVYHVATYTRSAAIAACQMNIKNDEVATIVELPISLLAFYDYLGQGRHDDHQIMEWAVAHGTIVHTASTMRLR